jgi:hypothetical protein
MGDSFIISGLREKRSAVAGQIVEHQREIDRLTADLLHIDAVLKIYGLEPADIRTKGRIPKRSAYFGRFEISRRCYDALREKGTIRADQVVDLAMREKGLDPEADRKLRADFTRRFLVTLHDMRKAGMVEKIGSGRGVVWRLQESQGFKGHFTS